MLILSTIVAVAVSIAIIVIGPTYLLAPHRHAELRAPTPDAGASTDWWLRLKGVRDVVAGLVVLAVTAFAAPRVLGIVLLIEAFTAVGDMSLIVLAKGSVARALAIHGATAAVMILAALALIMGGN